MPKPQSKATLKSIPSDKPLGPHHKVADVARHLGMSKQWVKQKIEEGKLDGYLFGNKIVITLESVNAYLEMCRITGQAMADIESEDDD